MQRYILIRVVQGFVTLLAVSMLVFFMSHATGDPLNHLVDPQAPDEVYKQVAAAYGLDKPLYTQYMIWLGKALRGDFGTAIYSRKPVMYQIATRLPYSLNLALVSSVVGIMVALLFGVVSAVKKDKPIDLVARIAAFFGLCVPHFWLGLILILIFSVGLGWLPVGGVGGPLNYVMPVTVLGLGGFAAAGMRLMRSSMLDVLDSEYVKMARIEGLSENRILYLHCLRNALIPLLTFSGTHVARVVGTAVVTEVVFTWPGIGRLAYEAIRTHDFPVLQGIILIMSLLVIVANLAVDVSYGYIDPRIRY